jgi:hypothetical protein
MPRKLRNWSTRSVGTSRTRARTFRGAALADLLALWLAGHVDRDDPEGPNSDLVREEVLKLHLKAVRSLVPINYETIIKPKLSGR